MIFNDEIKEKLNGYTKEEIIKALSLFFSFNDCDFQNFLNNLFEVKIETIHSKVEEAMEEWSDAAKRFEEFQKKLFVEHGKDRLSISELTVQEMDMYVSLHNEEYEAYEKWNKLCDIENQEFERKRIK